MTTISTFTKRHPVLTYYCLTFAISWSGGLIVLGPDGFLGLKQPLAMITHAGLSATSLILQPQTAGVEVVIYDLVFATALWVVVAAVVVVNRRQISRQALRKQAA